MKDAEGAVRSSEKGGPAAAGAAAEEQQVTRLHVGRLTRNVTEAHVHEIFSTFGKLKVRPQPLPPPSPPLPPLTHYRSLMDMKESLYYAAAEKSVTNLHGQTVPLVTSMMG